MRLGEEVRMADMKLKRTGTTWPTAREAGQLPDPTFKRKATMAPLHIKGEYGWNRGAGLVELSLIHI